MKRLLACTLLSLACTAQAQVQAQGADVDADADTSAPTQQAQPVLREVGRGLASWYGQAFHGRRTASGERFDMNELTAAHRTLPFGTLVRVRSLVGDQEVLVRINDRGPHIKRRVIDLSKAAAARLGLLQSGAGTKPVQIISVQDAPQLR